MRVSKLGDQLSFHYKVKLLISIGILRSNCRWQCRCRWISSISVFSFIEWNTWMRMFNSYTKIHRNCCSLFQPVIANFLKNQNFLSNIIHLKHFRLSKSGSKNITVRVGSNNWKSGGTVYKVHKLIPHENYNHTNFSNDICLIRINGKIKFNPKVQPIKYSKKFIKAGTDLLTTGWGRMIGVSIYETQKCA